MLPIWYYVTNSSTPNETHERAPLARDLNQAWRSRCYSAGTLLRLRFAVGRQLERLAEAGSPARRDAAWRARSGPPRCSHRRRGEGGGGDRALSVGGPQPEGAG